MMSYFFFKLTDFFLNTSRLGNKSLLVGRAVKAQNTLGTKRRFKKKCFMNYVSKFKGVNNLDLEEVFKLQTFKSQLFQKTLHLINRLRTPQKEGSLLVTGKDIQKQGSAQDWKPGSDLTLIYIHWSRKDLAG
jgi:hypothetical protein